MRGLCVPRIVDRDDDVGAEASVMAEYDGLPDDAHGGFCAKRIKELQTRVAQLEDDLKCHSCGSEKRFVRCYSCEAEWLEGIHE